MRISELIAELERVKAAQGDLPVVKREEAGQPDLWTEVTRVAVVGCAVVLKSM